MTAIEDLTKFLRHKFKVILFFSLFNSMIARQIQNVKKKKLFLVYWFEINILLYINWLLLYNNVQLLDQSSVYKRFASGVNLVPCSPPVQLAGLPACSSVRLAHYCSDARRANIYCMYNACILYKVKPLQICIQNIFIREKKNLYTSLYTLQLKKKKRKILIESNIFIFV